MEFRKGKVQKLFRKKCEIKEIQFKGIEEIFPGDIKSTLMPFWDQELGRLVNPLPNLQVVLDESKAKLGFLES